MPKHSICVGYIHTYTIFTCFFCVADNLLLQIEDMCRSTRASAVPVVPDSEGFNSLLLNLAFGISLPY